MTKRDYWVSTYTSSLTKGNNPFSCIKLTDGSTIYNYPQIARTYDPPYTESKNVYAYIKDHLEGWVEDAIKNRRQ